ncbi:MAG: hypothetical protein JOZ29_18670 [Deltaproteobacteria bacterium]|nr:hypothetical protein [Deltaproteobacteria bacterium]MBV8454274.1 hypothetical protein [Deltaproteobacteria bacterium]
MTNMTKMTIKAHASDRATWAVAEAKARFSEMIERALTDGPHTINLAEFFAALPLHGSRLKVKRTKSGLAPSSYELSA